MSETNNHPEPAAGAAEEATTMPQDRFDREGAVSMVKFIVAFEFTPSECRVLSMLLDGESVDPESVGPANVRRLECDDLIAKKPDGSYRLTWIGTRAVGHMRGVCFHP